MLILNRHKGERVILRDEYDNVLGVITVTHAASQIELGFELPKNIQIERADAVPEDDQKAFGLTKKKDARKITRKRHY